MSTGYFMERVKVIPTEGLSGSPDPRPDRRALGDPGAARSPETWTAALSGFSRVPNRRGSKYSVNTAENNGNERSNRPPDLQRTPAPP